MHWKNSDFQILYFIVGKCFTPDEAYRQLLQLKEDRLLAVTEYDAFKIETEAKLEHLKTSKVSDPYEEAKVKAEIIRTTSALKHSENCYKAAIHEIEFIETLISKVNSVRKFKDLPDEEAFQLSQLEEWEYSLIHKAKLSLLSTGSIDPELLGTMMSHPNWKISIQPALDVIRSTDVAGLTVVDNNLMKLLTC